LIKKRRNPYKEVCTCEVARELWSSLFHLFGIAWVMPQRVREFLLSWKGTIGAPYCFGSVEVGSFVFNVVYLFRADCKRL
jgi:hypothetical protein